VSRNQLGYSFLTSEHGLLILPAVPCLLHSGLLVTRLRRWCI
jgi:hypothetical protein